MSIYIYNEHPVWEFTLFRTHYVFKFIYRWSWNIELMVLSQISICKPSLHEMLFGFYLSTLQSNECSSNLSVIKKITVSIQLPRNKIICVNVQTIFTVSTFKISPKLTIFIDDANIFAFNCFRSTTHDLFSLHDKPKKLKAVLPILAYEFISILCSFKHKLDQWPYIRASISAHAQ